jgi:uncharacterized protein (TIGR02145 family)
MPRFYILLVLPVSLFLSCGSYDEVNSFFAGECGKDYYNPTIQFCQNAKIYDKCGGSSYDPLNQKCENNILFSKCGNEWYNPFSEFCANEGNVIENKGEFIDSRDGRIYKYVDISTQIWMAENLRYETSNTKCYDDNPDNCKIYGMLYDWNTARTICPFGWHLPSDTEWFTLRNFATDIRLMANSTLWDSDKGTDDFGFTALPGGYYRHEGYFINIKKQAIFWSATEGRISGSAHVHHISLMPGIGQIDGLYIDNSWASVRCVKN